MDNSLLQEEGKKLATLFDNLKRESGISRAEFARKYNFPGKGAMIHQHIKGIRPINLVQAAIYTKGLNCRLEDISPRLAKEARRSASLIPGYESNVEPGPDVVMSKPLRISGEIQGGDNGYLDIQQFPEGYAEGCVMNPVRGSNCYALRVRGDSMHPRIRHKEIIIINPDPEPKEGDEVVVNLKDGRQMVKIFLFEREGEVSLGSINDKHPIVRVLQEEIQDMHVVAAILHSRSVCNKA